MVDLSENNIKEQKHKFELFLKDNGVKKSFKQYSVVIEWKMCRDEYKTKNITSYTNLFACTDPKEFDELMPQLLHNPLFLKAKSDPATGNFSDHKKAMEYYSNFLHSQFANFTSSFSPERMIVIDMHSGSYAQERTGHELYNLERNPIDGRCYGYCPPHDSIDICTHFGAKKRSDFVDGILVVYVTKKENSNNREIIGFIPNARVYGAPQSGEKLSRTFFDPKKQTNEVASYSVVGDTLVDLRNKVDKFEIEIAKYNSYIFRMQRYYGGGYPELDKAIIAYVEGISSPLSDDIEGQEEVHFSDPATPEEIQQAADRKLNIASNGQGNVVVKDGRISKAALVRENYTCQVNPQHKTFQTTRNVPYMEGHHLIPCTVANAEHFMAQDGKNIDCLENIVCLCPTCHRAVHFGDSSTREALVKAMYAQQAAQLLQAGITITEENLLALYKC